MTERESFEVRELKKKLFSAAGYRCRYCGGPATDLAHKVANTKENMIIAGNMYCRAKFEREAVTKAEAMKQGRKVINHPRNLEVTCQKHNSRANIGHKTVLARALMAEIIRDLM